MRVIFLLTCLLTSTILFGQDIAENDSLKSSLPAPIVSLDTVGLDVPQQQDSVKTSAKKDIETTINYDAQDSMFFDVISKKLYMYGDTHIDYGEITLEADRTSMDWDTRTIESDYTLDSLGKKIGRPIYSDGPDVYQTDDIIYNFDTKRALIKGVVTEQDGAFMHGDDVKKNSKDEMFIRGARYTTCNLEHPHFFIESTKLKVIPNKKVVSGPFNLKFRDLPTPLFFPFGMFPQPKEKASGIIVPSYGEEQRRGFFLRDGGYYFAISDYADLRVTGDIYSKGGNGLNATSNYFKRYSFRGTFNFSYNKSVSDDLENPLETKDYWVRWNHRPETRGNSSFSASVSAGTSTYSSNNNLVNQDFTRSISSQFTSNISYTKKFQGTPFNISTNLRHNQNIQTGIVNLTLPDFTLNTNRQYPLKNLVKSSKSLLAKLNFSHNFVAKNELTNRARTSFPFNVANEDPNGDEVIPFNGSNLSQILDRSQIGGKHNIPISTSVSLLKFFTLSPSFTYQELWYTKELEYTFLSSENAVQVDTVQGFSRAGSWSASTSLNTRIYGTKFFSKGKIQAIRHVMTPSLSFSFRPDFTDPKYGVYSDIQTDTTGTTTTVSKYEGFAYGSPPGGESKTLGFSLSNNIEMKVASKKDTVTGFKKIKVFDNIGLSTGYNLAADSFNLSNISLNARTSFLNNLISLNFTGIIDPYIRNETTNERINEFAWNSGQGIGQLTSMTTAIGLNLSPAGLKGKGNRNNAQDANNLDANNPLGGVGDPLNSDEGLTFEEQQQLQQVRDNPDLYVDFTVPWTLRANYSINRTKRGFDDANIRQSLNFSGTLGLTDKTQITFNSGYDFEEKDFTTTRMGLTRDLHCWTMSFNWVPFGNFQSYFVSIRVKSTLLQDLKVEKRRSFLDLFN
ncbi:MAG: putative LPS assembly protein LptD [Cyclobacteriaceae bacterium]